MDARTDNRLDDMPMAPVQCAGCGARVLVRKSTWNQTSVQWDSDAMSRCVERREAARLAEHHPRMPFLVCSALRDSIEAAAVTGRLAIVEGD